jgi:hypothetical protein
VTIDPHPQAPTAARQEWTRRFLVAAATFGVRRLDAAFSLRVNRRKQRERRLDYWNNFVFFAVFCSNLEMVNPTELMNFAKRYAEARCSQGSADSTL